MRKIMAETPKDPVDLVIPLIPEMELLATKAAEGVGGFMKLDHEKIEEVKMALIEACINAIEHSKSKDGRINISFNMGEDKLTVQISDRGQGFNLEQAREELKIRRDRGEQQRGWGLAIMKELMDEVEIESSENGTTITMVKQR
jgi:serine/threonine-protein kinase RsbW